MLQVNVNFRKVLCQYIYTQHSLSVLYVFIRIVRIDISLAKPTTHVVIS